MFLSDTGRALPVLRSRFADPLVLSALVLALAPLWQLRYGVIPDSSWIITMCERVLAGDRLYVDLIETNPPFTVWMFLPPVMLAQVLGIAPEITFHLYAYAVCLGGLALAAHILRASGMPERTDLYALLPVVVALLVIFPSNSFAEREQLGVALLLPLLVLMAWRADALANRPGWLLPIAAGVCGSVIVLIKPYYAVMILAPALWVAWKRRSLWPLLAVEYWVIAGLCVTYLAAVMIFHPEFLSEMYPLLRDTYMRTSDPMLTAKLYLPTAAVVGLMIYRCRAGAALSSLTMVALTAAIAGLIPLLYQGKAWPYHAYPSLLLLLIVLAHSVRLGLVQKSVQPSLIGLLLIPATFLLAAQPFLLRQKPLVEAAAVVSKTAAPNPTVALIGPGIQAGHPLTRMIGGKWIGDYCSDWLGMLAALWGSIERQEGNASAAQRYDALLADYLKYKSNELTLGRPQVLLVQKGSEYWNDLLLSQPALTGFMDRYRFIAEDLEVRIYISKDS